MYVHKLKLRPPQLLPTWVRRPQLEERFHSGARVACVVAGPGYGKTVLAAYLHASWTGPKLWYSLDAADADLAVFAGHLDAGLRTLGVSLLALDSSNAGALGSPAEVAGRFADGLAELNDSALIVVDDVHLLEGGRALAALGSFIERTGRTGTRFVLCGRSMPLGLHSIAAAGQLVSITATDLAFDLAEAHSYLGIALGDQPTGQVALLVSRAEGWPAGLALMASSKPDVKALQSASSKLQAHDDETRRFLFDYLASEVLASLSHDERLFVLETSILEQLETALCDAVRQATDSANILASLAKRGLFVTRQSEEAYSSHKLFREFLRHNLAQSRSADEIARLHHRAATFLAARGDAAAAIAHELSAGDLASAASLLENNAFTMLRAGMMSAVAGVLSRLSTERIQASPMLLVALGRVQRERGEWDAALPSLERAIRVARSLRLYDALAEAVRTCAPILAARGEFERLRLMLDEALSPNLELPETSVTTLRMTLAAVLLEMDQLDDSLAIYREITPAIVARGDLPAHGLILHNTAVAHIRRGDIFNGLSLYERALKLKEAAGQRLSRLTTLGDLIYVKTLLGHSEEAEQLAETLLEQSLDVGASGNVARAHEQRGVLRLLRGDVDGALLAYSKAQEVSDPGDTLLLPEIEHGLGRCALLKNRLPEADELCARAMAVFRRTDRHQQLAPVLVTRAEIAFKREDVKAALQFANEAIDQAAQGANALLQVMSSLDAVLTLTACAAQLKGPEATAADARAAAAAASAVALIHQRDYRFLLRTKAREFESLQPHFRRWGIGSALLPEIGSEPAIAALRIEMLGTLRVFVNDKELAPEAWKRRRALDIFAYLVSQRGQSVTRARLIDLYWPDSDADAAHDSLRVTITAIRKALGDVIKYEANAYRFVAPPQTTVDIDTFDANLELARQADAAGDGDAVRQHYRAAVKLYRGEFLEGMPDAGWQWRERERLHAACLEALRWLAADRERAGDATGQRLAVERLLEVAPYDLEAVRMRLEALTRESRLLEARRDYQQWRSRYKAAVGVEAPHIWQGPETPAAAKVPVPTLLST